MRRHRIHRKVPRVALLFWVVKLLTTAMGEATSDFFIHRIGLRNKVALAGVGTITGLLLAVALVAQISRRRYVPWLYWTTVTLVAIFGTMAADGVHVALKVPYPVSAVAFAIALVVVFALWRRTEGTLSIHSIHTRQRELFYWATVLVTFALGTAVGDLTALTFHLGFLNSTFLFTGLIAIPAIGYRWFRWSEVLAFWWAYVLTRPLGASFADWFAFPKRAGGLAIGHGVVAVVLGVLIVGFVAYLTITGADTPERSGSHAAPGRAGLGVAEVEPSPAPTP